MNTLIAQCLGALLRMYQELACWKDDGSSQRRLGLCARQHVALFSRLRARHLDPRCWVWKPKHHLMLHVAEDARTNPKGEWNYADESEIGKAALNAGRSEQRHIETTLMKRYGIVIPLDGDNAVEPPPLKKQRKR